MQKKNLGSVPNRTSKPPASSMRSILLEVMEKKNSPTDSNHHTSSCPCKDHESHDQAGGPNLILSWAKTSAATFTHPMIWKLGCAGHPQFQWTKTSWIPYSNGHNWGIPYIPLTKTQPCAATACFMMDP